MRKLKLPQPYASMVVSGALETIPDMWGDVQYEEKIFIYADNVTEDFKDGLNFKIPSHRKVFNEMTLGNIPDNEYTVGAFLGYVTIAHCGTFIKYWQKETDRFLFIKNPRRFINPIEDYSINFHDFDDVKSYSVKTNRIKREGGKLIVPVGKGTWNLLGNREEYRNVFLFWENYMEKIFSIWSSLITNDEEIDEGVSDVEFKFNGKSMMFCTDGNVGQSFRSYVEDENKKSYLDTLEFDLIGPLVDNGTAIEDWRKPIVPSLEEQNKPKKDRRPWIRMISVPMGGITKWKRK